MWQIDKEKTAGVASRRSLIRNTGLIVRPFADRRAVGRRHPDGRQFPVFHGLFFLSRDHPVGRLAVQVAVQEAWV